MSRILIVGPSWVGDMVMAQSLFKTLKDQSPDHIIDVLAPAWSLPLLDYMPEVRQGITMPLGHGQLGLKKRWQLGRSLRGQYDQAIVLPNAWKSALVPWAAQIPKRTGWLGEMRFGLLNDHRRLNKKALPMTVQRFVALALNHQKPSHIPHPCFEVSLEQQQKIKMRFAIDERPLLMLCPGAEYGPAKRWPIDHYASLGQRYAERGWQVIAIGSDKDQAVAERIVKMSPQIRHLCGQTDLHQAIALLSLATAVVSNDSGLMHIAAALEKPLIALYGSSDPLATPPLSVNRRILYEALDCSPCFKRHCPKGHRACLTAIKVSTVEKQIDRLLEDVNNK